MENIAPSRPSSSDKHKLTWWVIGSIILHGLILWLFDQKVQLPTEQYKENEKSITATLVFAPPPKKEERTELPQEEVMTELAIPDDVLPEQNVVEADLRMQSDPAMQLESTPEPSPQSEPQASEQLTDAQLNDPSTHSRLPPISSKDILRKHMNALTTEQNQGLAENAARDYRHNRVSPKFPAAKVNPFQTAEEKLLENARVEVDCSNTLNKTVMAVAGLFGGMMKCTKPPPFQGFIDKRLKKLPDN